MSETTVTLFKNKTSKKDSCLSKFESRNKFLKKKLNNISTNKPLMDAIKVTWDDKVRNLSEDLRDGKRKIDLHYPYPSVDPYIEK